ncbi:MAG: hypothetical protein PF483_08690 [Halothiobacillus sp.]|nr:hypothetical protein [Halothiobacillus sp.]
MTPRSLKRLVALILLAGILGSPPFLISYYRQPELTTSFAKEKNNTNVINEDSIENDGIATEQSRAIATTDSLADYSSPSEVATRLGQQLARSKTAHEVEQILEIISLLDPKFATEGLRELNNFCSQDSFMFATNAVKQKKQAFCRDFAVQSKARSWETILESYSFESEVLAEERLRQVPKEKRSDQFTRMVVSVRFALDIDLLSSLNVRWSSETGTNFWKIGKEPADLRYPEANLLNGQTVALTFYRCARFGGCGKDHHYTVLYCQLFLDGRCDRNATVEEMLYQVTPPAEFNLAREILAELIRIQAGQ